MPALDAQLILDAIGLDGELGKRLGNLMIMAVVVTQNPGSLRQAKQ